jgi:hypothetical protein
MVVRKAKRNDTNHVRPVSRASRTVPNRKRGNPKRRKTRRREVEVIPYVLTIDKYRRVRSSDKDTILDTVQYDFCIFYSARIRDFHLPRNPRREDGRRRNTEDLRFRVRDPSRKPTSITNSPRMSWRNREHNSCASCRCNKRKTRNVFDEKCFVVPKSINVMTLSHLSRHIEIC